VSKESHPLPVDASMVTVPPSLLQPEEYPALFAEDIPARPSLNTLCANMSASTPASATMDASALELMSPLREQRASTANWSRYSRRDSFGAGH
ncbi:hypothetical protein BGW39_003771, partial [Mortierella sp. 14UC]